MMIIVYFLIQIKLVLNVKMDMLLKMVFAKRLISIFVKFLKIQIIVKSVFLDMVDEYNHLSLIVYE